MRTCSAMPLSAHMLLPNEEFNSGTESAGLNRRHAPDSAPSYSSLSYCCSVMIAVPCVSNLKILALAPKRWG
jgi:hypothetical protein